MKDAAEKYEGIHLLGRSEAPPPDAPEAGLLETFANPAPSRRYRIEFFCAEFTSLCPITQQPDFGRITISYEPRERCVETKSLKFYLAAYRNQRGFNEEIINRILEDFVSAVAPHSATVRGEFAQRGGITLTVNCSSDGC